MQPRLTAGLVVVGILALAASLPTAPAAPQTVYVTLEAQVVPCVEEPDGECLGFNGQIPGPMIDIDLGDTLVITLVNHYTRPVSWHVHGTALSASMDGIAAHPGTRLVESVAQPGGSFTYTVRAAYAGSWHYHDHVLGPDGSEGVRRGLYGGLVVRNGAEPQADHVLDLHMLDEGANGGRGLTATAAVGDDVEVLVVGLGDLIQPVILRSPSNGILGSIQTGPGLSDRFHIDSAVAGTYKLSAATGTVGTIEVS